MFSMLACSDNGETQDKSKADSTKVAEQKTEAPAADGETDSLVSTRPKIRDENNPIVTLSTDMGDMTLELYRDVAPIHVDSFLARTNDGFYNGLIFHRVWRNFMIQGGDPLGTGRGNAGYYLKAEFSDLPHIEGTLSMAHGREPNSASSQFFICLARTVAAERLDGKYTVFGHLLKGYEALHAIGNVACTTNPSNPKENTKPIKDVIILKAYLSDADGNPL
jgi:cyclophilin family peptidyl-prolyl cis-trans isomerase